MSDEELDKVAGGTIAETVKDTQFLHALGILDRAYTASEVQSNFQDIFDKINMAPALNGAGFFISASDVYENDYRILALEMGEDDEWMSRSEFYKRLCEHVGKPDFDYKKYL